MKLTQFSFQEGLQPGRSLHRQLEITPWKVSRKGDSNFCTKEKQCPPGAAKVVSGVRVNFNQGMHGRDMKTNKIVKLPWGVFYIHPEFQSNWSLGLLHFYFYICNLFVVYGKRYVRKRFQSFNITNRVRRSGPCRGRNKRHLLSVDKNQTQKILLKVCDGEKFFIQYQKLYTTSAPDILMMDIKNGEENRNLDGVTEQPPTIMPGVQWQHQQYLHTKRKRKGRVILEIKFQ